MKRRVTTTTETHEVWVFRREGGAENVRPTEACAVCGGPSRMLTPEWAAALCGVSPRAVYRWVEAGAVHFAETPDGGLFVCLVSLPHTPG